MQAKRYSYIVTIEQSDPRSASQFGSQEAWGEIIQKKLDAIFLFANVIEVKAVPTQPIRRKKTNADRS